MAVSRGSGISLLCTTHAAVTSSTTAASGLAGRTWSGCVTVAKIHFGSAGSASRIRMRHSPLLGSAIAAGSGVCLDEWRHHVDGTPDVSVAGALTVAVSFEDIEQIDHELPGHRWLRGGSVPHNRTSDPVNPGPVLGSLRRGCLPCAAILHRLTTVDQDRFVLFAFGQDQSWCRAVTIDHGAAEPLWQQLADVLRSKIESGELPAGRVIPSEATLSQEYGLSRGTVVKALDALERDGLVRRVQGRGTFVTER